MTKGMPVKSVFTLTLFSCAITACGGGGGGTSSAPTSAATTTPSTTTATSTSTTPAASPTVTPANLQSTVPASTYAAGSQELAFFNAVNDFRGKLGLGLVAQSVQLDAANRSHVNYFKSNSDVNPAAIDPATGVAYMHEEDPARPGFTGATALDRAKFAQYSGTWVGEEVAFGDALSNLSHLIGSVYHRQGLMAQYPRDFGIAVGTDALQTMALDFGGSASNWQHNASDYFSTYPMDKQTDIGLSSYPELPNPYPDITLNDFGTKTSFPVSVSVEWNTTLKVDLFTITEAGQSTPLDARLITADTDAAKLVGKYDAYLVAKAPFKANTTYNVSFKGSVNGTAVTKSWSFITGS